VSDLDQHLAAIVAGDPDAFGRWVAGAEPRVRASLSSFAEVVDTEAVVQETLLRIWNVAPRFQPDGRPDGLVRLAVRIARNLAIDETRRRRPDLLDREALQRSLDREAPPPPPVDPLLRRLIAACLEALPARPAAAIRQRLAARGGQPDHALAEAAGIKLNTFLQNVRRARAGLQKCLERQGVSLPAGGAA
jgi:RNA polymerase sigma-70 factor (ECF subfamily)